MVKQFSLVYQLRRSLMTISLYRLFRSGVIRTVTVALSALFALFPLLAFPQGRPMDAATIEMTTTRIKEAAQRTQTIASDFIQEKEMSMIREKIISKGKFYFKKEKMLRWEYLQPFSYLIIIRDDRISIRDDNKVNQFSLQSNKVFQEINRVILGSIRGTLISDEKNFNATFYDNGSSWIVKLKTLAPGLKKTLSEIIIFFDRKDYAVNRLDMIEPGGDYTRIIFSDIKLNQPIADDKFKVH